MLLYRFIDKNISAPPYRLLPLVFFVSILVWFLGNPHSAFYTFALADPDDYMRLNETINWLQWAGWFDLSHPRLSPGSHMVLHWSRLLDLPLALMMKPFLKDWGYRSSAMLAALAEPLILLGFLIALLPAMARPFLGRSKATLAVLFVPFAPWLMFNFSPGRVDHHNWEILIAGVGLMALPRMLLCKKGWKAGIFAAISFALGLWISPEIMPCLVLVLIGLALFSAWRGGFVLLNAAVFAVVFALATTALLPLAKPVESWAELDISWFSFTYVVFALLIGATFLIAWLVGRHTPNKILRLLLIAALGLLAGTLFFYIVPEALGGPFADFDDFNATIALDNIHEAQPLMRALHVDFHNHLTWINAFSGFARFLFSGLVAFIVSVGMALQKKGRSRMLWSIYAFNLGSLLVLAFFLQSRLLWFVGAFQIVPLAFTTFNWAGRCPHRLIPFLVFLILGPLPVFAVPYTAAYFLSPQQAIKASCNLKAAAEFIAGPTGYMLRPYTIMASEDDGPELLFRTPHNVIAANFNVPANKDVFDFFNARDDDAARAILNKWHAELVLVCRRIPPFYAGMDHPQLGKNAFLKMESDGKLHMVSSLEKPAFIEKLVNGPAPDWLKPVEIPTTNDYLLFEAHLPPLKK